MCHTARVQQGAEKPPEVIPMDRDRHGSAARCRCTCISRLQAALHANTTGRVPGPWALCSSTVKYDESEKMTSMLPVWRKLLAVKGGRTM